jgi:hypothetical protein
VACSVTQGHDVVWIGDGVVLSQLSNSKPGAPLFVLIQGRENVECIGEGVVLSQVSKSKPGAPLFVLIQGREKIECIGEGVVLSRVSKSKPPPREQRPVRGDPGPGGPLFVLLDGFLRQIRVRRSLRPVPLLHNLPRTERASYDPPETSLNGNGVRCPSVGRTAPPFCRPVGWGSLRERP